MAQSKITLGYWGIKGRGQAVRDFLEYLELPYENKIYSNPADWFEKDKPALSAKNPFANLPYVVDGENVVAVTDAIFHYLAHKTGKQSLVAPASITEATNLSVYRGLFSDITDHSIKAAKSADVATATEVFTKEVAPLLERASKQLSAHNWIAGENITYLDFQYYEIFKAISKHDASLLSESFKAHVARVEDLPQIKAFLNSDRYVDAPFLPPNMVFLNK
jgi:glutathione S-transferase